MPRMPFILPSLVRASISPKFFQTIPLIVEIEPDLNVNTLAGVISEKIKLPIGKTIESMNMFSMKIPTPMIDDLAAIDGVKSIALDREQYGFEMPSIRHVVPARLREDIKARMDGIIPTSQTLKKINADVLHAQGLTGAGIKCAVLDTGIDMANPQVKGRATKMSTMKIQPTGDDENGHGSHVGTTIMGLRYEDPITGLVAQGGAPDCEFTSIKVLGLGIGTGMTSDIMEAIELAVNDGNKVVNMSLGSEGSDDEESDPMVRMVNDYAEIHPDVIFCIAGGNSGEGGPRTIGIPACANKAITVGAWGIIDNTIAYFSSRGPTVQTGRIKPDICAPGGGRKESKLRPKETIWSGTALGSTLDPAGDHAINGFCSIPGTSMGCPHVSYVMTLWKQFLPELTSDLAKGIFMAMSGQKKNSNDGWGLIDATWILSASEGPRSPPPATVKKIERAETTTSMF